MAKMLINPDKESDDVLTTRIHLNRLFGKDEQSKAALVERIVKEWCEQNAYETFATAEGIGGK